MLPKMQQSHFVKKYSVQFVNAAGKLSAPFYFWDNKPHECSQTWQVVRSEFDKMMLDNAREHGVEVHEGTRVLDVLFEGDRAVGVTRPGRATADARRSRQGRRRRQRPDRPAAESFQAARVGSGPQQERGLDLLAGRLPRHRQGRRRDDGAADRRQARLVLVHPAARRHRQRRRRRAGEVSCSRARAPREQIYTEEVAQVPGRRERIWPARRASPATSSPRTTRTARPSTPATAGC